MTRNQNVATSSITWKRLKKNLGRIVRSCVPPVLHKPFGWSARSEAPRPETPLNSNDKNPEVAFELPVVDPGELWPGFDRLSITMNPRQIRRHLWAMPENEIMVLSAICAALQPRNVFEFGTFTGASTLAIAANSPSDVKIHTLDIPPEDRKSHRTGVGSDIPFEFEIGQAFRGTKWESNIQILTADARKLDVSDFKQSMDLVFVDADHTYSFVKNDTEKALQMLKPGGVILWHDYRWDDESPECAGVTRCVNEFHKAQGACHEIDGTRFAVFQSPLEKNREVAA